jgi:hypothetical protein
MGFAHMQECKDIAIKGNIRNKCGKVILVSIKVPKLLYLVMFHGAKRRLLKSNNCNNYWGTLALIAWK